MNYDKAVENFKKHNYEFFKNLRFEKSNDIDNYFYLLCEDFFHIDISPGFEVISINKREFETEYKYKIVIKFLK